jgi:hypothetical protein
MVHDPLANCQPDTVASIMAVPMKAPEHVEDIVISFFDTYTIIGYFKVSAHPTPGWRACSVA